MIIKRGCLLCLSFIFILSLSACKKEPKIPEGFGNITQTESSKSNISSGKEIEVQNNTDDNISESSTDQFSIINDTGAANIGKSEEEIEESKVEKQMSEAMEESEQYYFTDENGADRDIRIELGYKGILESIQRSGGIEKVVEHFDRDYISNNWKNFYIFASDEEINKLVTIIYDGTSEEKAALETEIIHTVEPGWYQDESGIWKNVYNEDPWDFEGGV